MEAGEGVVQCNLILSVCLSVSLCTHTHTPMHTQIPKLRPHPLEATFLGSSRYVSKYMYKESQEDRFP
jgi:hypothetical protein